MLHLCLTWMAFPFSRKQINYNSEQTFLNVSILVLIICNEKNLEILLRVSNFKQKYFASKQMSL